jgi:DNA mismatch repair protein MutS
LPSILFPDGGGEAAGEALPAFLGDLNLDQVFAALAASRSSYRLTPFFAEPLGDTTAIVYRHEVFRDLESEPTRRAVETFVRAVADMRERLDQAAKLHYRRQRESWFLDAVGVYLDALRTLTERLSQLDLRSRGFRELRAYLARHVASAQFRELVAETLDLQRRLAGVAYSLRIRGSRVTVNRYADEPDQSREVGAVFARFQQGATKDYQVTFRDFVDMNHVEAMILDRVAQLHAEIFPRLSGFCASRGDFVDPVVGRFDREIQFYLAWLDLMGRLRAAGLSFCYPEVSSTAKQVVAEDTFDVVLASKLVGEGRPVVCNDLALQCGERIFVVTGPNQGGKTTFARTFGQLHHLGRLGLPVPGRRARLFLCDRVFTHFEKEELVTDLRSKLEDELIRIREILEHATADSVVIMNESLASTTVDDALFLGRDVLLRLLDRGVLAVYVTFIDELTRVADGLVSMVSTVFPDDPARRTFKVVRQAADGRAYAMAIAEKYGLTFRQLEERIGR